MTQFLQERLATAKQVAREAGSLALSYQQQLRQGTLAIQQKGEQDFVSEADRATERLIREALTQRYPEDGFLGEETGSSTSTGRGTWVVDPIDGTTNFLRQQSIWCVSIAYLVDGEPQLGVIYAPVVDELFCAQAGEGAYLNDAPLQVNQGELEQVGLVDLGYSANADLKAHLDTIERLLAYGLEYRRHGSAAIGLAHVAAGRFDGFKEDYINSWDIMAGVIILREAGAWVHLEPRGDGYAISAGVPSLKSILA